MKKFQRLISLIYLLQRGPVRAKRIAKRMGTSERTVFRDIVALDEALGDYVKVRIDQDGYALDRSLYVPPLHMIDEELDALSTAVNALDRNNPHFQLAHQALSKIQNQPGARPSLADIEPNLAVMHPAAKDLISVKRLQELEQHLRKKRVLILDYFSHHSGTNKSIRYAPYALLFRKNAWYLLGLAYGKGHLLLLRAGRIKNIAVTDEAFEIPKDFSVGKYFQDLWDVYDGKPETVQLRFAGQTALRIQEMCWHPSQKIRKQSAYSIILELQVPVNPEFINWVLGHGAECEVLIPQHLKEKVKGQIGHLYEQYF